MNAIKLNNPITGREYFLWGIGLFLLKYPLDYLVATGIFEQSWDIFIYFSIVRNPLFTDQASIRFWITMLAVAFPFLGMGLVFTARRLKTLRIPLFWLLCFFVPFLNVVFFILLAVFREKPPNEPAKVTKNGWLDQIMPRKKSACILLGIISGTIFSAILFVVSRFLSTKYGVIPFIGLPFFAGFLSIAFINYRYPLTFKSSCLYAATPVLLGMLFLLVTLLEGILCLVMSAPIALALSLLGGSLAYYIDRFGNIDKGSYFHSVLILPAFFAFDVQLPNYGHQLKTVSKIEIRAEPEIIWQYVVQFPQIRERENGLFSAYLPKLEYAEINGRGAGAIRKCHFDRGTFIEPITVWDEPNNLTFSVSGQIEHYQSYLETTKGQFLIQKQPNGSSMVIGTTWYELKIFPNFYWNLWVDHILHGVHMRALNHIKFLSEQQNQVGLTL